MEEQPSNGSAPDPASAAARTRWSVSRSERLGGVLRFVVIAAFFVHLGFLLLFIGLEVWLLAALNVLSVGVYALCSTLMTNVRWQQTVLALTGLEVVLHAALASLVVGWGSGFHYYVLAFTPLIFLDARSSDRNRSVVMGTLLTLYIGISLWTRTHPPLHTLAPLLLHSLHYFNMILALVMLAMILNVHSHGIQRAERRLQTLAETDRLTGLPSRRGLLNLIETLYSDADVPGATPAAILIDVDHFKRINDQHGHGFGDSVLATIARSMQTQVRDQDALGRWGGEEFVLLLHDADLPLAFAVAERIRGAVTGLQFHTDNGPFSTTVTTGIALWQNGESFEACLERADKALYHGKESGRNRSVAHHGGTLRYPA